MITVKEIAKRFNVSASTISNIINGKPNVSEQTRQKVLDYIKVTGYQPNYFAQSMRRQSNRTLSIITEDLMVFGTNPIVHAIMAYCDDNNYRTILMNLRLYDKWKNTWYNDEEKLRAELYPVIQEALSIKVDGIIYVAGHCRIIDCFPSDLHIPAVITYGISKDEKYPSIIIDDEKGGYDITRYLMAKGHKKIGIIAGAMDNLHTKSRLLGYQRALFDDGVLYNPSLVRYGNWKRSSGYHEAKYMLENGVTAIFCMNDDMAAGAYDYFYEQNIMVGRDISIVGYDNMEISEYMRPGLTTNEIQLREIGRKSAEIMLNTLDETEDIKSIQKTIRVPCNMIERASVMSLV